jgi:hypothetical protein
MKKSTSFLMGMAALLLAFGLFLAGCGDSGDPTSPGPGDDPNNPNNPGGGGLTLADIAGTYQVNGYTGSISLDYTDLIVSVSESKLTLTVVVSVNAEKVTTEITGVTIATGGSASKNSSGVSYQSTWVYLVNDKGQKIGVINHYMIGRSSIFTEIYLGKNYVTSYASSFASKWSADVGEDITDDSITGSGDKY